MAVAAWMLERDENCIVFGLHYLPDWYGADTDHQAEAEDVDEQFDALHLKKIEFSEEIFVVDTAPGTLRTYWGESTRNEIEYAVKLGKRVRRLSQCPEMLAEMRDRYHTKVDEIDPGAD